MPNDFGKVLWKPNDAGMLLSFAHYKSWKIIFLALHLEIFLEN